MKMLGILCLVGGIGVLALAVALRVMYLQPLLQNPVTGLWKVSVTLLLIAIAIGVNKK